ncbi:MAG TPA: peptidoglycan-associated lipoprotein Pal [Acidobacteriota bacterium]|nr:peptidoglycan-associated lipoprotein Pal [Acidobacteriota bacterium]
MAKRLVLVMIALALVAAGCGGGKQQAELEESGAGSATWTQDDGSTGADADRADREAPTSTDIVEYDFNTIYFDFDKYNLRADAREALDRNAELMRANPDLKIVIEGHCDERGTDEYNLALGERRAKAARDYLTRLGIDAARITVISYGEERPVSLGHDEGSWRLNRRGEFGPR